MKKITAILLAMLMLLCGCGKDKVKTDNNVPGGNDATIQLGDTALYVGSALTAERKEALGKPVRVDQAPSCLYEGMDAVYSYDGFYLQTNQQGNAEILCMAVFESDAYATTKGVKVGSTLAAVKKAYGEPAEDIEYYVAYHLSETVTLTFYVEDDTVTAIEYAQIAV